MTDLVVIIAIVVLGGVTVTAVVAWLLRKIVRPMIAIVTGLVTTGTAAAITGFMTNGSAAVDSWMPHG